MSVIYVHVAENPGNNHRVIINASTETNIFKRIKEFCYHRQSRYGNHSGKTYIIKITGGLFNNFQL
jgi:hypothetical protein